MKASWLWVSVVAGMLGIFSILAFKRLGKDYEAQVVAVLTVAYGAVLLALWATESKLMLTAEVNIYGDTKLALIAVAGGWLAQTLIAINKLANSQGLGGGVMPIVLRAVLGAFCGVVAVILVTVVQGSAARPPEELAALVGLAGGAAGISVLDLIKRLLPAG